jgi:hypothetical protein
VIVIVKEIGDRERGRVIVTGERGTMLDQARA